MTDDDYRGVCFFMENAWKGEFNEDKRDAYRVFLDKFESEHVLAALHALAETSGPFLPAVSEIVQAARELQEPAVPGWSEVYTGLTKALHYAASDYFASNQSKTQRGAGWLAEHVHPLVGKFF